MNNEQCPCRKAFFNYFWLSISTNVKPLRDRPTDLEHAARFVFLQINFTQFYLSIMMHQLHVLIITDLKRLPCRRPLVLWCFVFRCPIWIIWSTVSSAPLSRIEHRAGLHFRICFKLTLACFGCYFIRKSVFLIAQRSIALNYFCIQSSFWRVFDPSIRCGSTSEQLNVVRSLFCFHFT